jgi:hypothetical protein
MKASTFVLAVIVAIVILALVQRFDSRPCGDPVAGDPYSADLWVECIEYHYG